MTELWILGLIVFFTFVAAFYQSYRDRIRWRRIVSGMSLFGDREVIPPLLIDGVTFNNHNRRVVVIWGESKLSSCDTVFEAKEKIEQLKRARARGVGEARIFAWDGDHWEQRK